LVQSVNGAKLAEFRLQKATSLGNDLYRALSLDPRVSGDFYTVQGVDLKCPKSGIHLVLRLADLGVARTRTPLQPKQKSGQATQEISPNPTASQQTRIFYPEELEATAKKIIDGITDYNNPKNDPLIAQAKTFGTVAVAQAQDGTLIVAMNMLENLNPRELPPTKKI
jgi:hypothetical protein